MYFIVDIDKELVWGEHGWSPDAEQDRFIAYQSYEAAVRELPSIPGIPCIVEVDMGEPPSPGRRA